MKKQKKEEIIPPLTVYGEGKKRILIVNGIHDATYNLGKSKEERFLRKTLYQMDLDGDVDAYYVSLFNSDESSSAKAITLKRKSLDTTIKRLQPLTIILLGELPYRTLLYPRMVGRISGMGYASFLGEKIPDQELGCFVCPVEGIEELLATKKWQDDKESPPAYELDPSIYLDWKKHLNAAFTEEPFIPIENKVITTQIEEEAISLINKVMLSRIVSFDYETTGLKPYRKGHKIVSISLSDGEYSYSFPFFDTITFKETFKNFLLSDIRKISHNLQFEAIWSKHIFGVWPTNWYWDTMIVQHCLDNNKPVGLKYLTYSKLGVIGYDDSIDEYIKSIEEEREQYGDNAFNRITEAPLSELLEYNALDSLYTYYIYKNQKAQIAVADFDYLDGIKFATETHITFAKMSYQGMCVDEEYLRHVGEDLQKEMAVLADKIMQSDEVKQWDDPTNPFNFGSSKQLSHLLFGILKIKPIAYTELNAPSVDKINLPKYDLPFIKDILAYRKLSKVYDTYIKSILREVVDSKVHSHLSLSNVKTYRSCVAKGSLILAVRDFTTMPHGVPIEEIKIGDYVYCFNDSKELTIKKVLWAGKTGHKKIVRIHYSAGQHNKGHLDVTPEHKIRLINGEYVRADELMNQYTREITFENQKHTPKIRVLSCFRYKDKLRPTHVESILEHRFIYEHFRNEKLLDEDIIHHIDGNHLNHVPENLEKTNKYDHAKTHYKQGEGLASNEARRKNIEVVRFKHANGLYVYRKGKDNPTYLKLTREDCLRLLIESGGRPTKIAYDFDTFKKHCKDVGLDIKHEIKFITVDGKYLTAENITEALLKYGFNGAFAHFKFGYARMKWLCEYYGIDYQPSYHPSQMRVATINNHVITSVENLDEEVDVYDLEIEDCHNFIANEICVHNSAGSPNLQNNPKRDPETKKYIRRALKPSPGHKIVEYDHAQLEVRIAACHNQDPNLIKYIMNPEHDMHRDSAMDGYILKKEEVTKEIRQSIKSDFVFAEFYGSYYPSIAYSMWQRAEELNLREHLKTKGIHNYKQFENHIKRMEEKFWNERFPTYKRWRKDTYEFYKQHGYVEQKTGFRCVSPMKRNNAYNSPGQGDAAHVLLWGMNKVHQALEKRGMNSKVVMEIHDSLVIDLDPNEEKVVDYLVWLYCTQRVVEWWDWINIPLMMEKEASEVNGNWAETKGYGYIGESK